MFMYKTNYDNWYLKTSVVRFKGFINRISDYELELILNITNIFPHFGHESIKIAYL